ncbi:hypothetical protein [Curtobacterium pusillum]|uniref:hypothetical protein n=1 Tax=Curtobacterium pusillum TaxID=69373 RepID=UPI0011AB0AAC|nr:hypothetical protein [Curtobacterium pusillum]
MNSIHRPADHAGMFVPRTLTRAEIEAGRTRPIGSPEERAERVRGILRASTFSVAPRIDSASQRGL